MAQHVLARAEEELPNRRKKRAVALIVAAVLALAGVGALAASLLWREQAASMKQVEQTEGDYAGWAIEDKAALVRALVDSGHLMQGGETERLFDEGTPEAERHAIADALLLALTGQTEVAEISVDIITYAVMAPRIPGRRRNACGGSRSPGSLTATTARTTRSSCRMTA